MSKLKQLKTFCTVAVRGGLSAAAKAGGHQASGHLTVSAPAGFGRRQVTPQVPRFRELHSIVAMALNQQYAQSDFWSARV